MPDNIEIVKSLIHYRAVAGNYIETERYPYRVLAINGELWPFCYSCDNRVPADLEQVAFICKICKREYCKACAALHDNIICFSIVIT